MLTPYHRYGANIILLFLNIAQSQCLKMCVLSTQDDGLLGVSLNPNLQGSFIVLIEPKLVLSIDAVAVVSLETRSIAYHSFRPFLVRP